MSSKCAYLWSLDEGDFPAAGFREDQLRFLLGYAALAPSGHNTQPWLFRVGTDKIDVIADRRRALPVVDPFDRELTISCGAAIGNFEVAARHFGFYTHVDTDPISDEPDVLACISLEKGEQPNLQETALFDAIRQRRTDRTAFSMEPVADEIVRECQYLAELFDIELRVLQQQGERAELVEIAELVAQGDRIQFDNPEFRRELGSWVRSERLGSRDGMSGAGFGMPDLLSPMGHFVIRSFDIGAGIAAGDKKKILLASPALLLIGSPGDERRDWLSTGRALARILLLLNARGYSASYLNQPIEIGSLRPKLRDIAGIKGHPQILLRAGRSNQKIRPSVRRNLSEVILN